MYCPLLRVELYCPSDYPTSSCNNGAQRSTSVPSYSSVKSGRSNLHALFRRRIASTQGSINNNSCCEVSHRQAIKSRLESESQKAYNKERLTVPLNKAH
ncbi:hypothetical protein TNCV_1779951 [Trichonephila clavipes]|nr:hypothetical protein TNCV_1779951 [Trichonephila clavipes]